MTDVSISWMSAKELSKQLIEIADKFAKLRKHSCIEEQDVQSAVALFDALQYIAQTEELFTGKTKLTNFLANTFMRKVKPQ